MISHGVADLTLSLGRSRKSWHSAAMATNPVYFMHKHAGCFPVAGMRALYGYSLRGYSIPERIDMLLLIKNQYYENKMVVSGHLLRSAQLFVRMR